MTDQELIMLALKDLGCENETRVFQNGQEALSYLYKSGEQAFLILSDINMPLIDGITFMKNI